MSQIKSQIGCFTVPKSTELDGYHWTNVFAWEMRGDILRHKDADI